MAIKIRPNSFGEGIRTTTMVIAIVITWVATPPKALSDNPVTVYLLKLAQEYIMQNTEKA
jgi:hypothetical protein